MEKEKAPRCGAVSLDAGNVDGVWSFRTLANLELHFVAFSQLVELYALKFLGVKEEILFLSLARDETESAIRQPLDCSLLHNCILQL